MRYKSPLKKILIALLIFALGVGVGYLYFTKSVKSPLIQKNKYRASLSEIYDKTKENYWESISDEQLIQMFRTGVEKLSLTPIDKTPKTKDELLDQVEKTLSGLDEKKKKEFTVSLASGVLSSLSPNG